MNRFILTLSCVNRIGIVYAVSRFLFEQGANIVDSAQFDDQLENRFFLRAEFEVGDVGEDALGSGFAAVAQPFDMAWAITPADHRPRTILMVSKFDHCLVDLLYRASIGELKIDVTRVVSNHPDAERVARSYGVPFLHLPVAKETKQAQEARLLDVLGEDRCELVVLARYMQVLSNELCAALPCPAINIHHSFLPSFKGAKPYHQAYARGVKLIGATAHYVTSDLDEGPIIEQDVERVSHAIAPDQLVAIGRDIEKVVLARAVRLEAERRVLMNGARTVIFR